jgi:hypothetical protein
MAFVAKTVQKTPTYPIVENHAQSTTQSLARPSTMREATMTAIATPMRPQAMLPLPSRVSRDPLTADDASVSVRCPDSEVRKPRGARLFEIWNRNAWSAERERVTGEKCRDAGCRK